MRREIFEELGSELENLSLVKEITNDYVENAEQKEQTIYLFSADLTNKDLYSKDNIPLLDHNIILAQWISIETIKNETITLHPKIIKDLL